MLIESVTLRNIGPFEKEKFNFDGNLIGIVGPNGSGKSTLLESILVAWANVFRKFPNMADFVRDLPNGGKSSSGSIQSRAVHNGIVLDVRRTINLSKDKDGKYKGSQSARLIVHSPNQAEEEVKGVKNVDARLYELIGEDLSLMSQFAFIEQNDISAIVDSDSSSRSKALHKLFGLKRYEKIWDVLGEESKSLPEIQSADDLNELDLALSQSKQDLSAFEYNLATLKQNLADFNVELSEKAIKAWEDHQDIRDSLARIDETVKHADSDYADKRSQKNAAEEVVNQLRLELDGLTPLLEDAKSFIANASLRSSKEVTKQQVEQDIKRITDELTVLAKPNDIPTTLIWTDAQQNNLDELSAQLSTANNFIREHSGLLGQATCPTCGQTITDIASQLEQYKRRIDELSPVVSEQKVLRDQCQQALSDYNTAKASYDANLNFLTSEAKTIQSRYTAVVDELNKLASYDSATCEEKREIIRKYDNLSGSLSSAQKSFDTWNEAYTTAQVARDNAIASRNALHEKLRNLSGDIKDLTPDSIERHRNILKVASDKRLDIVRTEESIRNKAVEIDNLSKRIVRAQSIKEQIDRIRTVKDTLLGARNVFHREKLPSVLARRFVAAIDTRLQYFLNIMRSNFCAGLEQVDGSYFFRCLFDDGSERDASCLSGGEKVRFSISFLLAVNEIMSRDLGVLALDEPTAQLDEDNIQSFIDILSHVQRYARSSGVQIIVVTHSNQLIGSFDQTVSLLRGKQSPLTK